MPGTDANNMGEAYNALVIGIERGGDATQWKASFEAMHKGVIHSGIV